MPTIIDDAEREPHGAFFTTNAIARANRDAGFHYFDADTMRFFGSRVLPRVFGGHLFVTSERSGFDPNSPRRYSVREVFPDGSIDTVGEFNEYATAAAATRAADRLSRETHSYYFDGRHGKNGRTAAYIVTGARDPWHAMERLHRNFRIRHMGRAEGEQFKSDHYTRLEAKP